jgi:tRNA(adenine34) deaminase
MTFNYGKKMMNPEEIVSAILESQKWALDSGNPPFAAVIACDDRILASSANDSRTTGNPLHHAEMLAVQHVIENYGPEILRKSHLYASNEPCPMCVGACIWSGIPHVTYFLSQQHIYTLRGWGRFASAQTIASADDSGICISGPLGNDEMLKMHKIFWTSDGNSALRHSIHLAR